MAHTTDTLTISATRLLDVARETTLRLGKWQYHQHLIVHLAAFQLGSPAVFFTLADGATRQERLDFIDEFAAAMGSPVATHPRSSGGWLMAVHASPDVLPVAVSASVNVGGA